MFVQLNLVNGWKWNTLFTILGNPGMYLKWMIIGNKQKILYEEEGGR